MAQIREALDQWEGTREPDIVDIEIDG